MFSVYPLILGTTPPLDTYPMLTGPVGIAFVFEPGVTFPVPPGSVTFVPRPGTVLFNVESPASRFEVRSMQTTFKVPVGKVTFSVSGNVKTFVVPPGALGKVFRPR